MEDNLYKNIAKIMENFSNLNIDYLEYEGENFKLKLKKNPVKIVNQKFIEDQSFLGSEISKDQVSQQITTQKNGQPIIPELDEKNIDNNSIHIVKSPIIGTFYRSPAPDKPPFVEIGNKIKKGDILCIIEAMKVMNKIESEVNGEIVEILVENGKPVEYGTPLFKIKVY
ncbi:MAG: acetyl-CoA carboxylase biotin carboxyl carrier protein [Spirochaetes bacterium]|nr:acetyl-CoA carboxylase biotin carboxyl carrier protein [Spirochaetota bacterium]